jgi:hypothetical protein
MVDPGLGMAFITAITKKLDICITAHAFMSSKIHYSTLPGPATKWYRNLLFIEAFANFPMNEWKKPQYGKMHMVVHA